MVVNQSRAIQQLATKLSAEIRREVSFALIGSQSRSAARAVLSVLTDRRGCLHWNSSQVAEPDAWVTSRASVRDAMAQAAEDRRTDGEVVVVIEHMEKLHCDNIMYLNNLMLAMDRSTDSGVDYLPTTLFFLFEEDPPPGVLMDGGVRSHLAEGIDKRCRPGPELNLKAFFGRTVPITFLPVPDDVPRDTQPLCSTIPLKDDKASWASSWLSDSHWSLNLTGKLLVVAAMGWVANVCVSAARRWIVGKTVSVTTSGSEMEGGESKDCRATLETLTSVRGGKRAVHAPRGYEKAAVSDQGFLVADDTQNMRNAQEAKAQISSKYESTDTPRRSVRRVPRRSSPKKIF